MKITKDKLKKIIKEELINLLSEEDPGEVGKSGMVGSAGIHAAKKLMVNKPFTDALESLKGKDDPAQIAHFLSYVAGQVGFDIPSNLALFKAAQRKQARVKQKAGVAPEAAPEGASTEKAPEEQGAGI